MASVEIMVVDDDTAILKLFDTALSQMGYVVTVTADPSEALQILKKKRFDLVITDLIMEPLDGFEMLKTSKALYPEMPLIVLTGHPGSDLVVKALKLDADDYLFKPLALRDLYYAVSSCLEKTALQKGISKEPRKFEAF
jgi:DNA-binding NtrC family response regulator